MYAKSILNNLRKKKTNKITFALDFSMGYATIRIIVFVESQKQKVKKKLLSEIDGWNKLHRSL